jgi:ParB-like chromosome segregation protein Spo0J
MALPQASFDPHLRTVELTKIVPLRVVTTNLRASQKYRAIASSMQEIGMVEPLVIHPHPNDTATYLLLDGHLRLDILRAQGATSARCLLANDDEAYTYNKRINPLSTIQEHRMIMKAIKDGVSEERIASVLHIDLKTLRQKRDLLVGICPEAADLLKDKAITAGCFTVLRKMTPLRQIEAAELMSTISNYSMNLAKTILAASSTEQLAKPGVRKAPRALSPEQLAQLEQEMTSSQAGLAALKDTYGTERLELQVACRYLATLLGNERIRKYLLKQHLDLVRELEQITKDVTTGEQTRS